MTLPRPTLVYACALGLSVCGTLGASDATSPTSTSTNMVRLAYFPADEIDLESQGGAKHDSATDATSGPPGVTANSNQAGLAYSLRDLEALSLESNPALAEARSRIEVAHGDTWQAGLPPNPTLGYVANEVGNEGTLGQHGAYAGQRFVRGGKLQLSREVQRQEVQRLRAEYEVARQRVLTDVRAVYFEIIWLQQSIELLQRFLETNRQALTIANQLYQAGDNTKSDVLLAEIEFEQTATEIEALGANYEAKWRELKRVVGLPQLNVAPLSPVAVEDPELTWEQALRLMDQSPRLAALRAEVARSQMALRRAIAEPIPDLNAQLSVQYDFGSSDTFAGLQLGMPIPIRNQNQGGIYAAGANVRATMQKMDRVQMLIGKQLAVKFGAYQNARKRLQRIAVRIVPKAEEVVKIALEAYKAGEVGMPDVLNAQGSMLKALRGQLDAKQQLQLARVAIEGYLLEGGLGD